MRKREKIWIIIGICITLLICFYIINNANTKAIKNLEKLQSEGVFLLDKEGNVVNCTNLYGQLITVKENDMIITGKATSDMSIILHDKVERVALSELNQGDYKINIFASEKKNAIISFDGNNTINLLYSYNDMKVNGNTDEDVLSLTESLGSAKKMEISSGTIRTAEVLAHGGLVLNKSPRVYVEPNDMEEYAILEVMGTLEIDLEDGGILKVNDDLKSEEMPAYIDCLDLGENTKVNMPLNGYLREDLEDDSKLGFSVFFTEDGDVADEVEIIFYMENGV